MSRAAQHACILGLCRAQRVDLPAELDAACGIGAGVLLGTMAWAVIVAIGFVALSLP